MKKKKHLEISSSFYNCLPKIMIRCKVPEIWCVTDGQMDRRMDGKSDIREGIQEWAK